MVMMCRLKLSSSPSQSSCSHPKFLTGRCTECGKRDQHLCAAAPPFRYIRKGLRISHEEANRIRESGFKCIKSGKRHKLFLVLDLDHTLLHTAPLHDLYPLEEYQCDLVSSSLSNCKDSDLFRSRKYNTVTKLRPFARHFLEQASQLFDLCIYTMGVRSYAKRMARLLDPDNEFVGVRVISREDCREKNKKSLDLVLAAENVVVIVDDTPSVWGKHWKNLITVEKYNYFSGTKSQSVERLCRVMAPMMDEQEEDYELLLVLEILKDIHRRFFNDPAMGKDVKKVLEALGQEECVFRNQMDCS